MKTSSTAWWIAAVLATMLAGEIGSLAGRCRPSLERGMTTLELLPPQEWGFGTIREMGEAWGPWGRGGFITRRRRLGFFAVSVLTRSCSSSHRRPAAFRCPGEPGCRARSRRAARLRRAGAGATGWRGR